jgi:signal peptidase I
LVKPGEVERGDIVIFHFPLNPREDYIKRVIGLPGEVVSIQSGKLSINGQLLNEPYISEAPLYSGTWTVPEGQLFLLGDDRNRSSDSHTWGFVPFENVVSKVQAVYYPLEHIKILGGQTH